MFFVLTLVLGSAAIAAVPIWLHQDGKASRARELETIAEQQSEDVSRASSEVGARESAVSDAESEVGFAFNIDQRQAAEESLAAAREDLDRAQVTLDSLEETARDSRSSAATASERADQSRRMWAPFSIISGSTFILAVAFLWLQRGERRREYENRTILEELNREEQRKQNELVSEGKDPLALTTLWDLNRSRLEGYHTIVTNYATSTRRLTQVALASGFVFLIAASAIALLARTTAASVATSVVAAAGAALGGFVARAVLRNAEASAGEMRAFFNHPLEVERFLSAERLTLSMTDAERTRANTIIVEALVRREASDPLINGPAETEARSASDAK